MAKKDIIILYIDEIEKTKEAVLLIKVDLITGFLGSGKTTFIKLYAKYLIDKGLKISILENDYGAVNVDMMLLGELEGEACGLDMVAGACDADCHKRRFKTKLIAMGMSGYDRVIIEPSGVFDIDEFFDSLYEEPLDRWYEIGSVIAVVDANLESGLSESADYLLASQAAMAGKIVLSKAQQADEREIENTVSHIQTALGKVRCGRNIRGAVIGKDWSRFTDDDFTTIMNAGFSGESFVKRGTTDDSGFQSLYFMNKAYGTADIQEKTKAVFSDKSCGNVFRIKGFVKENGSWFELNATKQNTALKPIAKGQEIIIVIGEKLDKSVISRYF